MTKTLSRIAPWALVPVILLASLVFASSPDTASTVLHAGVALGAGGDAPQAAISLPIEVYAPDGRSAHTERVSVNVLGAQDVDSLFVEAHQPFYHRGGWTTGPPDGFDAEAAASIRVNDGTWVDVRDGNVDCAFPESSYDCVAGAFSTVRFTIPVDAVEGVNTVDFRYNGTTDNVRSGFRVLHFGFMTPSDPDVQRFGWQDALPGARVRSINAHGAQTTSFVWQDVSLWEAPDGYTAQSDIDAGRALWQNAVLVDLEDNPISATCADCHAADGRDMQYFSYTNRTIIARSRAHGLSDMEANQVAAFIRSIPIERVSDGVEITPPGTPWDPPYQPGFGYGPSRDASPDNVDPVYWAAGAGLGWVLDQDREMLPYVFPRNGDPAQGIDETPDGYNWSHVDLGAELNMREIPVAVQFPDWNNWVPDFAPVDYAPSLWSTSTDLVPHYETTLPGAIASGNLSSIERELRLFVDRFRSDSFHQPPVPSWATTQLQLHGQLAMYQWKLVKTWELQHAAGLEDKADDLYCSDGVAPYCEPLGWLSRARHAFDVSPHITGSGLTAPPFVYGTVGNEQYMSHIWYQLGVTVNPGTDPRSSGQAPVDWGYQESFLEGASEWNGDIGSEVRQFASEIKEWQQATNGYGVDGTGGAGYDASAFVRGASPSAMDVDRMIALPGAGLTVAEEGSLVAAGIRAWLDYMMSVPVSEFPRTATSDNRRYLDATDVPDASGFTSNTDWGQKIYQRIPVISSALPSIPSGALDSLALWGDNMWPDDVEDYPGQPTKSWPDSQPTWDELVAFTAPQPPTIDSLASPIERSTGVTGDVDVLADRWRVRAGSGGAGRPEHSFGVSGQYAPEAADGQTCAFRFSNMRRVLVSSGLPDGSMSYHARIGTQLGDVYLWIFAQGRSARLINTETGDYTDLVGQVSLPSEALIVCNGTGCSGWVGNMSVGTVPDPTPDSGGTCAARGELGETGSTHAIEFEARQTSP